MYVPPFVCGIFFTIIVEIAAVIVWAVVADHKNKKRRK